tara:strand:+ start:4131 stop:4355 length:225 start_codon:yes stop_codon:yes gene_type:complete
MPSYKDILEMDSHVVFERLMELSPEAVFLLLNDMRDIIKAGTFPIGSFYGVKSTDDVLRTLLSTEDNTVKNEAN